MASREFRDVSIDIKRRGPLLNYGTLMPRGGRKIHNESLLTILKPNLLPCVLDVCNYERRKRFRIWSSCPRANRHPFHPLCVASLLAWEALLYFHDGDLLVNSPCGHDPQFIRRRPDTSFRIRRRQAVAVTKVARLYHSMNGGARGTVCCFLQPQSQTTKRAHRDSERCDVRARIA